MSYSSKAVSLAPHPCWPRTANVARAGREKEARGGMLVADGTVVVD